MQPIMTQCDSHRWRLLRQTKDLKAVNTHHTGAVHALDFSKHNALIYRQAPLGRSRDAYAGEWPLVGMASTRLRA